jgi:YD repeat-containing protein
MPRTGDPSGLVAGYSGPGAATVLPGGTQDPLAVLQEKKTLVRQDEQRQLASSQKAVSQLTGAWDRDMTQLAGARKAYVEMNADMMQRGIDPQDPANEEAYNTNRLAYDSVKDQFLASAQQKKQYEAAYKLLAGDKAGKYNREESSIALEEWGALSSQERAQTPIPIPSLKPDEWSTLTYAGDISEMITLEMEAQEPFMDKAGNWIYPEASGDLTEEQENLIRRGFNEQYKNITKGELGEGFEDEKGYQKWRNLVIAQLPKKKKQTIKGVPSQPAADRKAGEKKIDLAATRERIERMRGGDTEALQGLIGEKHDGNTITQVTWDDVAKTIRITTEDDSGHLTVSVIDAGRPESLDQLANIITGDKMSDSERKQFKAIDHGGYDSEDTSEIVNNRVTSLAGAGDGSDTFGQYEGKLLTLTVGGENYDGVIEEITKTTSMYFGAGRKQLVFKIGTKKLTVDTETPEGKEILRQIVTGTGVVRSKFQPRKAAKTGEEELDSSTSTSGTDTGNER